MTFSCVSDKGNKRSDKIRFSSFQISESRIMLSFGTFWVLLFALLSNAVLDNYCEIVTETPRSMEDIHFYTPGHSMQNCSATYPKSALVDYDITQVRIFIAYFITYL